MIDSQPAARRAGDPLDVSRPTVALFWGMSGAALALAALLVQGAPTWASLLRVGSRNPLRAQIERDLGPLGISDPTGHDGQLYYLVARDPFASRATVDALIAFDTPRYRYRRILVPILAGGFGQFSPRATLFGMITCAVLGMVLAAIGIADLAHRLGTAGASVFLGILNLGAIVSVMLVTVDVAALGLSLIGAALLLRNRIGWALVALAAAALTKETYLLVPLGLAAWQWRLHRRGLAAALVLAPVIPLALWSAWLVIAIPGVPEPRLLGLPVIGMVSSVTSWLKPGKLNAVQVAFAVYTAASVLLSFAALFAARSRVLGYLSAPWLLLALFTGAGVWGIPTNVGRAFSILWPLGVLFAFERGRAGTATRKISR